MKILTAQEFEEEMLPQVLNRGKADISSIEASVKKIVADVRDEGDKALLMYTEKFDKVSLTVARSQP